MGDLLAAVVKDDHVNADEVLLVDDSFVPIFHFLTVSGKSPFKATWIPSFDEDPGRRNL